MSIKKKDGERIKKENAWQSSGQRRRHREGIGHGQTVRNLMVLEESVIEGRKVFVNTLKYIRKGSEFQLSGWFRRIVDDVVADHSHHPDQENPFCRGSS